MAVEDGFFKAMLIVVVMAMVPVYLFIPSPVTAQEQLGGLGMRPPSVTIAGAPLQGTPYLIPQQFLVLNYAAQQITCAVSFQAPDVLTPGYEPIPSTDWLSPYPSSTVTVAPAQGDTPTNSMFQLVLGVPREAQYLGQKWEVEVIVQRLDAEFVGTAVASRVKIETQTAMITGPNGGEVWQPGSAHEITWLSANPNVGTVKIEYFNGTDWVTIADNAPNTGSYMWTLPNQDFNGGIRITITDAQGNQASDQSDGNIIVDSQKPTLTLLSPVGGEVWGEGSEQSITWTASDANFGTTPITLDFYDGSAWSSIGNVSNTGNYTWAVPFKETSSAKIRVTATDLAGNTAVDVSQGAFTMKEIKVESPVKVTSPKGGEVWGPGTTHEITWTSSNPPLGTGTVDIEYWDGKEWVTIVKGTENDGSYTWTVLDTDMSDLRIRITITDPSGKTTTNVSNGAFSIGTKSGFPMMYLGLIGGLAVVTVIVGRLRWRKTHPA